MYRSNEALSPAALIAPPIAPPLAGALTAAIPAPVRSDPFAAATAPRPIRARDTIHRSGDPARGVFVVRRGAVMLVGTLPDGRRQIYDILGPGDVFGLSDRPVHGHDAVALTDCVTEPFGSAQTQAADVVAAALATIARQHRHAMLLGRLTALERVAAGVLRLSEVLSADGVGFDCPLSRQDLADWLGLVIETVSRNLTALQRRGLIGVARFTRFEIRDRAGLDRLLEPGGAAHA
jgi:CRP-like cAMP-binding protein